jgi:hypothetical protein
MKSKANVILLGILVFLLGGVAGAVSHYLYRNHVMQTYLKNPRRFDVIDGMAKELKLDPKQKENIKIIIGESRRRVITLNKEFRPQYEAINKNFMPQFEVIRKSSDQRIRDILRPDQQVLFENFLRKIYQPPQMNYTSTKNQSKN